MRKFWKFFIEATGLLSVIISMHAYFVSSSWQEILRLFCLSALGLFGVFMFCCFIADSWNFSNERFQKKQKEREREAQAHDILNTLPISALLLLRQAAKHRVLDFKKNDDPFKHSITLDDPHTVRRLTFEIESDINALLSHRLIYLTNTEPATGYTFFKYHLTNFGLFCSSYIDIYLPSESET